MHSTGVELMGGAPVADGIEVLGEQRVLEGDGRTARQRGRNSRWRRRRRG